MSGEQGREGGGAGEVSWASRGRQRTQRESGGISPFGRQRSQRESGGISPIWAAKESEASPSPARPSRGRRACPRRLRLEAASAAAARGSGGGAEKLGVRRRCRGRCGPALLPRRSRTSTRRCPCPARARRRRGRCACRGRSSWTSRIARGRGTTRRRRGGTRRP